MVQTAVSPNVLEANDLSELEIAAWQGFIFTHSEMIRDLDAMLRSTAGVSAGAFAVLHLLTQEQARALRVTEIAERTRITISGISRIVAALCEQGMAERQPDRDDGRAWLIALTPHGAAHLTEMLPAVTAFIRERFTGHFSDTELADMSGYWNRLHEP